METHEFLIIVAALIAVCLLCLGQKRTSTKTTREAERPPHDRLRTPIKFSLRSLSALRPKADIGHASGQGGFTNEPRARDGDFKKR